MGSTKKLGLNLEKAVKRSNFTPPSLIKATPSELASNSKIVSDQKIVSNQNIAHSATLSNPVILRNSAILSNPVTLCNYVRLSNPATPSNPATFSNLLMLSNADDVMLTSPSQSKDIHNNNSTRTAFNPLEGKTTAVIAAMRGNPKDDCTRLHSNKNCMHRMVQVLLDSGSDGDLIFVNKVKPMLLPYSPKAVSTVVECFKWDLPVAA